MSSKHLGSILSRTDKEKNHTHDENVNSSPKLSLTSFAPIDKTQLNIQYTNGNYQANGESILPANVTSRFEAGEEVYTVRREHGPDLALGKRQKKANLGSFISIKNIQLEEIRSTVSGFVPSVANSGSPLSNFKFYFRNSEQVTDISDPIIEALTPYAVLGIDLAGAGGPSSNTLPHFFPPKWGVIDNTFVVGCARFVPNPNFSGSTDSSGSAAAFILVPVFFVFQLNRLKNKHLGKKIAKVTLIRKYVPEPFVMSTDSSSFFGFTSTLFSISYSAVYDYFLTDTLDVISLTYYYTGVDNIGPALPPGADGAGGGAPPNSLIVFQHTVIVSCRSSSIIKTLDLIPDPSNVEGEAYSIWGIQAARSILIDAKISYWSDTNHTKNLIYVRSTNYINEGPSNYFRCLAIYVGESTTTLVLDSATSGVGQLPGPIGNNSNPNAVKGYIVPISANRNYILWVVAGTRAYEYIGVFFIPPVMYLYDIKNKKIYQSTNITPNSVITTDEPSGYLSFVLIFIDSTSSDMLVYDEQNLYSFAFPDFYPETGDVKTRGRFIDILKSVVDNTFPINTSDKKLNTKVARVKSYPDSLSNLNLNLYFVPAFANEPRVGFFPMTYHFVKSASELNKEKNFAPKL